MREIIINLVIAFVFLILGVALGESISYDRAASKLLRPGDATSNKS